LTLQALSNIKHPPVVYAKQANFAQNQQINNGLSSPARETENRQTQLLEKINDQRLEPITQGETIRADSLLEAVGEQRRAQDAGG
jgi:hypothetical protein